MKKTKIFFPYCGETMGGSHLSSLTLIEKLKKKYDVLVGVHKMGMFSKYFRIPPLRWYTSLKPFSSIKEVAFSQRIPPVQNIATFLVLLLRLLST